jgi:protein SCO1/2
VSASYSWKLILPVLIIVALLAIVASVLFIQAEQSRRDLPILGDVPPFAFDNAHGGLFGREQFDGKITIVDFIFTNCATACPVMAVSMEELYRAFAEEDRIQFVSISVDPYNDTQEVLQEYAAQVGVSDSRWVFLRSQIDSVADLCENGFRMAADDLPGGHSTRFVLVDPLGQIRGYYDGMDEASMKILKTDIVTLARQLP